MAQTFRRQQRSLAATFLLILVFQCWGVESRLLGGGGYSENKNENSHDNDNNNNKLRVLSFGTSQTYGYSLEDRRHQAYPWLLSKDATNLAIRSNGPTYPAICTQTMVGDDDQYYDVITLEYYMRAQEGLLELALRLRQRFPDAIIIFFKLWSPAISILHKSTSTLSGSGEQQQQQRRTLPQWLKDNNQESLPLHSDRLKEYIFSTTAAEDWVYRKAPEVDAIVERAAVETGGHIMELPRPEDPRVVISDFSQWFHKDFNHLSERGHQMVAQHMQAIIDQHLHNGAAAVSRQSDRLGTWGEGDSCHSWYADGNCNIWHDPNLKITLFGSGKFSLEVHKNGGGRIQVKNPFAKDMTLHFAYMASGPPPSDFPKTRVIVSDSALGHHETILDPTSYIYASFDDGGGGNNNNNIGDEPGKTHVSKISKIAVIPPGSVDIFIEPLEETEKPFRLTGVGFSGNFETSYDEVKFDSFG